MISPEAPPVNGTPISAHAQSLRARIMAMVTALLLATALIPISTLAETVALAFTDTAQVGPIQVFLAFPCPGDRPGFCPDYSSV